MIPNDAMKDTPRGPAQRRCGEAAGGAAGAAAAGSDERSVSEGSFSVADRLVAGVGDLWARLSGKKRKDPPSHAEGDDAANGAGLRRESEATNPSNVSAVTGHSAAYSMDDYYEEHQQEAGRRVMARLDRSTAVSAVNTKAKIPRGFCAICLNSVFEAPPSEPKSAPASIPSIAMLPPLRSRQRGGANGGSTRPKKRHRVGTLTGCGHCYHTDCYQKWEEFHPREKTFVRCPLCDDTIKEFCRIVVFPKVDDEDQDFDEDVRNKDEDEDKEAERNSANQAKGPESTLKNGNLPFLGNGSFLTRSAEADINVALMAVKHQQRNMGDADFDVFEDAQSELTMGGVIIRLVDQCSRSNDGKVVAEALDELTDLACGDRKTRIPICIAGGISGIVRSMSQFIENTRVQLQACQLLGSLALSDSATERIEIAIVRAGGIQALLRVMKKHLDDKDIQEQSCYSLGKVICEDVSELEDPSVAGGSGKDAGDPVKVAAAEAIAVKPNNGNLLVVEAQVEAVLSAMKKHPCAPLVQTYGCYALSNLAVRESCLPVLECIVRNGGVETIVAAIQSQPEDPDVADAALTILATLIENMQVEESPEGKPVSDPNCDCIVSHGGTEAILQAMSHHMDSPEIQQYGVVVLHSVLRNCSRRSVRDLTNLAAIFARSNGARSLIQAMDRYAEDLELQQAIAEMVYLLATVDAMRPSLRNARAVGVLRVAMEIYSNDETLMQYARQAVKLLQQECEAKAGQVQEPLQ